MYDYVVIGAGTAGCAVAARLSADPSRSVLALEAGGSDRRLESRMPLGFAKQFRTKLDWAFETEPEPGCDDRRIFQPRGKMLGGTSGMNGMVWVRGHPSDFDGWDVPGWDWSSVKPVFERVEQRYDLGHEDAGRPVRITRRKAVDPVSRAFVQSAMAAGHRHSKDVSGPELDGVAHPATTVYGGRRWSMARAYLDDARKRPNLDVVTHAHVRRVVIENGRVTAVEWDDRRGRRQRADVRREAVLCAGAFGTPHLLQLSGVGDPDHLTDIGITPLVESPEVGRALVEHPLVYCNWELRPGQVGLFDAEHPKYLAAWLLGGRGKLGSNYIEAVCHARTDPALHAPDVQIVMGPGFFFRHGEVEHERPGFLVAPSLWTPRSRGTVLARSADPHEPPAIQLNMLAEREDLEALIRAVRMAREIVAQSPLAEMAGAEIHPGPDVQSDAELERFIRATCEHTYHPAGSARMGPPGHSVLDEHLRVRGVEGLRVADTSAVPVIPRANTMAVAVLIGERCADAILSGDRAEVAATA